MIFAAGFGTRMGQMTRDRPKPLIRVAGRALVDHALTWVDGYGARRIVLNLHYKGDMLRDHLAHRDIVFSDEQPEILETGGGLKAALPLLGRDPVFTMNADAVWMGPNPLTVLARHWNPDIMDALLLCVRSEHAMGHMGSGDFCLAQNGQLKRGGALIYSGLQILKTARVNGFAANVFSVNDVWDEMDADDRLYGVAYDGKWCDVGHPAGIKTAEAMLKSGNA